jgi:hypothetical protein
MAREARIQRDAVAAIEKTEGDIAYNWEWKNHNRIRGAKPWAPRWLVDRIGVDYFGRAVSVWKAGNTDVPTVDVGR